MESNQVFHRAYIYYERKGNRLIVLSYLFYLCYPVGVVYYFSNDGANLGSWSLHTKLIPEDGKSNDWFGDSVVLDQNVIVVGAPQDDDNGSLSGMI